MLANSSVSQTFSNSNNLLLMANSSGLLHKRRTLLEVPQPQHLRDNSPAELLSEKQPTAPVSSFKPVISLDLSRFKTQLTQREAKTPTFNNLLLFKRPLVTATASS